MEDEEANIKQKAAESDRSAWLRAKIQVLWSQEKHCGLCLEVSDNLCPLKMEFIISENTDSKSLHDIANYVFGQNIEDLMVKPQLCENCIEKTMQAYMFVHNTKLISKVLLNCVNDVYYKVSYMSSQLADQPKAEPDINVMIVVENEEEVLNYIDQIKSVTEIIPTDKPVKRITVEQKTVLPPKKNTVEGVQPLPKPVVQAVFREQKSRVVKNEVTPNITLKEGKLVVQPLTQGSSKVPTYNTYKCNYCEQIFGNYRTLKEHEKCKHTSIVFVCKFCDKKYNTQQYLTIHYKSHGKERCKLCQAILDEGTLNDHLRSNHENFVYCCQLCDLVYYTAEQLEMHMNSSHIKAIRSLNSQASQCVLCLKSFPDNQLKSHKCRYGCPECFVMPCVHVNYLRSYREQTLNHAAKISCMTCDYVTKRKEHLITHVNREHLDHHPFTCDDCGNQFYTKLSLRMHIGQYHQDLKICEYCDSDFKTLKALETHKNACKHIIRAYNCKLCVASFDTDTELENHEKTRHSAIVYPCNLCKKEFITEVALQEHQSTIHAGIQIKKRRRIIECTLCDIYFSSIKEMLRHEETHDANAIYPCKVCSKTFSNLRRLYSHKQRHYTERIVCVGCNKNIASTYFAQHSVRCPYLKGTSHVCETCGKSFHQESQLKLHQATHMKKEPCPECGKMIKPSGLKAHIELVHLKKSRQTGLAFACKICGHKMNKKTEVEPHINRFHLKIKPFSCHICHKKFCGKPRLREHMDTHLRKHILCHICDKKFANKVCLKMHLRIHTGECPYPCDVCGQRFRTSSMMNTHRLKKHLERTVFCPLCDNDFHLVGEMRNHFKRVHWKLKDQPFDPKLVPELDPKYYYLFEDRRLPQFD